MGPNMPRLWCALPARSSEPLSLHHVGKAWFRALSTSTRGLVAGTLQLRGVVALLMASACLDPAGVPSNLRPSTSWAIRTENARPGSSEWDSGLYSSSDSKISGYILPFTVQGGDTLHFFVAA